MTGFPYYIWMHVCACARMDQEREKPVTIRHLSSMYYTVVQKQGPGSMTVCARAHVMGQEMEKPSSSVICHYVLRGITQAEAGTMTRDAL
jgi:hypothetical protein